MPYTDDPQPNFAYFCYNGVPAWQAAVQPGVTPVVDFGTNVMRRLPIIHLLATKTDVENGTWFSRYGGDVYPWLGTLVYDGKVYDHVHFRARGGVWRYAMVKNMWKFDLNRGHDFEMRDDYGRKYDSHWTKLNLGAPIQQGDYWHRGEQGMFESVGFRLFNLAGVESPKTTFVQFRIIDESAEASVDQYEGDFWGVYLAVEQKDGRFLDEHHLPDGNFYKMEGGTGELNNLGPAGPTDKSDLNYLLNTYRSTSNFPSEQWWRTNLLLANYYSYQAIAQGIHHYDICYDRNYFTTASNSRLLQVGCTQNICSNYRGVAGFVKGELSGTAFRVTVPCTSTVAGTCLGRSRRCPQGVTVKEPPRFSLQTGGGETAESEGCPHRVGL